MYEWTHRKLSKLARRFQNSASMATANKNAQAGIIYLYKIDPQTSMRAASTKGKEANTLAGIFEKNIKHAIKNGESFLPIYIKGFSDTHREYNKYVDMTFKMIRTIEEKYFGKTDGETVKAYEEYTDALFKSYISQINTSKETLRGYLEMHHLFMKSCNDYWKKISDEYQKQSSTRSTKK